MSGNEISSSQQRKMQQQAEAVKIERTETPIEVFVADDVSPIVNLKANENNSVFIKDNYLGINVGEKEGSFSVNSEALAVQTLPSEIEKTWSKEEIALLKSLPQEKIDIATKFAKTHLEPKNILAIALSFSSEQADTILTRVNDLESQAASDQENKTDIFRTVFDFNSYDKSEFDVRTINYDLEMYGTTLNKDLSVRSTEITKELFSEEGQRYRDISTYDLATNTLSRTRYDYDDVYKTFAPTYEIRSKLSDDNKMISREYSKPSEIDGIFETEVLTKDGPKQLSDVRVNDRTGKIKISKDMESLDGTRTQYSYVEKENGDYTMKYKITTRDGEVLMDNKKKFRVKSDTEFHSQFNDDNYTMRIVDDKLVVTQDENAENTATIDLGAIKGDKEGITRVLKSLTGDELIKLSKTVSSLEGISDALESYYQPGDKSLHSGDDKFVLLHEAGHAKDYQNVDVSSNLMAFLTMNSMISKEPELKEIYDAEREAFVDAFPEAQRQNVDYFINILTHYSGEDGGLKETIAEGNAISSTPKTHELLTLRTQYLQQYFPRTMAKLNTYINENRVFDIEEELKKYGLERSDLEELK